MPTSNNFIYIGRSSYFLIDQGGLRSSFFKNGDCPAIILYSGQVLCGGRVIATFLLKIRLGHQMDEIINQIKKHTPSQIGNGPKAGIEPKNSLDLFGDSIPSTKNPNQRFAFDKNSNTLHRFYNDGNGTWHWSGSTNQGANSLSGKQVPSDIKNIFGLPRKGW